MDGKRRRAGYRPRRSGGTPTVADPSGPMNSELDFVAALHPDAMDFVDDATIAVFNYRLERPIDVVAEQVVHGFIASLYGESDWRKWSRKIWLSWKIMLNVVRDIAVADPRYYGIKDPTTEQYCSKCRKVKKLNEFPPGRIRCYECGEWRSNAEI